MLDDAEWRKLEPLIEACRPRGKTPQQDLRRTVSASSGVTRTEPNGAPSLLTSVPGRGRLRPSSAERAWVSGNACCGLRSRPGCNSEWRSWMAPASAHIRRPRELVEKGSQAERDRREALGRSRGGFGTKACVIADGLGRAVAFILAPGQAHELPHAIPLLGRLPGVPKWEVADQGYAGHAFREHIWTLGARPAIPPKCNEAPVACPDWIYNSRNLVERLWAHLKEWRAIATRYENTASSFMGVLALAAALDWIKS